MASLADAKEALRPTNTKANFQRLTRLLMRGGLRLLRETFDSIHPPADLPLKLSDPVIQSQLRGARLTQPERACLYPSSGVYGKSTDFDITLIFRLLRRICNLTPPPGPRGWDVLPNSSDYSLEADLVRIKYYRNEVYGHSTTMEISDAEFLRLWKEISEALLRIAATISHAKRDEWKTSIDDFLSDPLTSEEERCIEELNRWYKNDTDVKAEVEKLDATVEEVVNTLKDVQEEVRRLREEVRQSPAPMYTTGPVHVMRSMHVANTVESIQVTQTGLPIILNHPSGSPQVNQQNLPDEIHIWNVILSFKESFLLFAKYLRYKLNLDVRSRDVGSLLIIVEYSSLQSLEGLWEDYCSGHLNKITQEVLVTADVLEKLGLTDVKLKTFISEEEYQRGKQILMDNSGSSSGLTDPVRYVNFLACEGYTVEIIGGKHFKTPEGEFVEMKSGTHYQIHVKNTRAYGCNLDISIDGYDVGRWTVDGGDELSIERPVYEPKKFTFYRVKTAPKEAGIESGRSENGVVKCVFTPEAFFDVPVIFSGSSQPLDVNMPPSATVGDLKREVQRQLNASHDPYQVLAQGDKVLSNSTRLRSILEPPSGNLRLIDIEIQITVEASGDKVFPVKIQPGKAKVRDLMEQIERELGVPIMDQKLYLGKARLSDTPRRGLPHELICSQQPTVVAIVSEYIHITVEDQNGESNAVKIDKEKNLRALMDELPSCSDLQENEEAMFHFNGKQLCPSKDEGTLTTLGVRNGSRLELKVKILFIEIFIEVSFLGHTSTISVRCSPQETFQDLVKKIEMQGKKREQGRVTFVMEERVFDPDQDKGPLQDYGITHRSALQMKVVRPDSPGAQASQPADEFNIGVAHNLHKQGDSLDEFEERQAGYENAPPRLPPRATPRGTPRATPPWANLPGSYSSVEGRREDYPLAESQCAYPRHVDPEAVNQTGESRYCYLLDEAVERQYHEEQIRSDRVIEPDPAWRAGGTTLQGYSSQQFMTADPIKVDHSKKVELVVRLVAREDEGDLVVFPKGEFKPLSTLHPPAVPE